MNIIDVKNMYSGSKYEGKLDRAVRLFEKTGDDVKSGYLGSVITNIGFDNLGNFEFSSEHMASNLEMIKKNFIKFFLGIMILINILMFYLIVKRL